MLEPSALFDEPERVDIYAAYPQQLVQDTGFRDGLRFVPIGEDGDNVAFLGHPELERMRDVLLAEQFIEIDHDSEPDVTWARLLTHCPDHLAKHTEGCQWCEFIGFGDSWWLDWSKPDGQPLDHHATAPGYFPVTIWEVIQ